MIRRWWACKVCGEYGEYRQFAGGYIDLEPHVYARHWHMTGAIVLGITSERAARLFAAPAHPDSSNGER